MNVDEYEIESAAFTAANMAWNRAQSDWLVLNSKRKPTEEEQLAYDMAELKWHRAEKAHAECYSCHSAASPDTSEQRMSSDGFSRVPLTADELAARDVAQKDHEETYWPSMKADGESA